MEFLIFVGMIIGACVVGKKIYEDKQYEKARADFEWRERMHKQSIENEEHRLRKEKQRIMTDEYRQATTIADKFKKEAELVLFERKCLKSSKQIILDCKGFLELKMEKINGVEFYNKKWKDEYDCLIENVNDEKYIDLHKEIKEFAVNMSKDYILSSLKETQFGKEMIGKALDVNIIYGKLCVIIGAINTDKYNDLLDNLNKYLDAVFSDGLVYIKQLEYGKFELPLDDPNEMLNIQQHEKEIKQEIQEKLVHIVDNTNDDFNGMLQVFNLDFLRKTAMLMWYYAKKKTFDSDDFYKACSFFDEFTATVQPISERIIAEIYAKNQIGGLELVRQDINKYSNNIIEGKALYKEYIASALAWMELYDLELNVLKNIVNAKGTINESMQERLSFLSDGGTTNIKVYDINTINEFFYYDSSSCEWTPKEYEIFFKKISMKNISLKYSLSINIWRKTIPLMPGQKIKNNDIYEEFQKMTQDFDDEVKCRKIKSKAVDLENMIYDDAILFEFSSERNRCMSILFYCEKFGRNLNLVIITMFTPENDLIPEDMKKYALAIQKNIYVESFRESILQSIDEVLKEKKQVYKDESEAYDKNIFE